MQLHGIRDAPGPPPDTNDRRIWTLVHGPCWCRGTPGDTSSFDLSRYRAVDLGEFDRDIVLVSDRIIDGSIPTLRRLYAETPDPKLVIAVGTCPAAETFWEHLKGRWTPVSEVIPIDLTVNECVSARPESLVAAILMHLTRDLSTPAELETTAGAGS